MKIDHVHFYARNAARTKDWFIRHVGFKAIANYLSQHTHTELIALNSAYFLISSPLSDRSPVASYLANHPEGIADIAFRVEDLGLILDRSRLLGQTILEDVRLTESPQGNFSSARITGWQDLQHTLIETKDNLDCCLPISIQQNRIETPKSYNIADTNITDIDHVVLNVGQGELDSAVTLYQDLFDFRVQQNFQIQTSKSGLTSQALIDDVGEVQFNINQPTTANSQIQEFINLNHGSGIQHLALRSQNLIADVVRMSHNNVQFLNVPKAYYKKLRSLSALSTAERKAVAEQQILVDWERYTPQSLLMQIFTQPILEQPTFFLEFIERRQSAQGFGQGNFQALFEAVERQTQQASHTTV
ncbi:MAG: 4-hydroxyphenylpyruvate dioxygenase [Cyanobacteria bacterium J06600_6]